MAQPNHRREGDHQIWLILALAFLLIVGLVTATPFLISRVLWEWSLERAGQFGDQFGLTNSLFSGLAFAGVIGALFLQRRELQFQREELQQTREELRGQKEQLEAQNKTLRLQAFENTFFQLIRLHNDIVHSLTIPGSTGVGRPGFQTLYSFFREQIRLISESGGNALDSIEEAYRILNQNYHQVVGHYFRNLYGIVKFIANSKVENPKFYADLVRAQLSTYELPLLFYSCLSRAGRTELKPLVERFGLLEGVSEAGLLTTDHLTLYDSRAFGRGE